MFALLLTIRGCPLLGDKSPLATQQVLGPLALHAAFGDRKARIVGHLCFMSDLAVSKMSTYFSHGFELNGLALHHVAVTTCCINPKEGCKVDVVFSTERYKPEEGEGHLGKCSARVFFKNQKPRPAINVTCTRLIEKKKRQQEDYLLYKQMKQLKNPLETVSIPDNHGHIDPSLRPIWDLAFLGSSYVMWEMTTQVSHYYLTQLTSVRQWVHSWMDHQ
ncbi:hypothetical protein H8959_020212 [Pygathrix nigripes]